MNSDDEKNLNSRGYLMKEYVREMRKLIGQRPLLLCGASVIIVNEKQQVLMLRRTDNDCWCFPGGAIELGESVEEAAKREVYEETGIEITNVSIFGVFSGEKLHYIYPNGDEVYVVDVVYFTRVVNTKVTIDEESKDFQFFDIHNLPENISPPVKPIVEEFKERSASILEY